MTLIDKAALLNRIATEVHYDSERSLEMYAKLLNEINDAPTVDAEPVVRCKDCRYCTTNTTVMTTQTLVHCNAHRIMTEWDGYCYKGEKR